MRGISGIVCVLSASAAFGQGTFRPIALNGDPVPGLPGATFINVNLQSGMAITDEGYIVFAGFPNMGGAVLCATGPNGLRLVARDGPAPGGGSFAFSAGRFNIRNGGGVGFQFQDRIYVESGGALVLGAGPGTPYNGGTISGGIAPPQSPVVLGESGHMAFTANYVGGLRGVFVGPAGGLELVASTVPANQPGLQSTAAPIVNASGAVLFAAIERGTDNINRNVLIAGSLGSLQTVVRSTEQVPGLPQGVIFQGFSLFSYNGINASGAVVFAATMTGPGINSDNNAAVWIYDSAGLRMLLREGDEVPGDPAWRISLLFDADTPVFPVISDGGYVMIPAQIVNPPDTTRRSSLIVAAPDGSKRELAREGWRVPGEPPSQLIQPFVPFAGTGVIQINARGQVVILDRGGNLLGTDETGALRLIGDSTGGPPVRLADGRTGTIANSIYFGGTAPGAAGGGDGRARILNDRGEIVLHTTIVPSAGAPMIGMFITRIPAPCDRADFNHDGQVDLFDYLDFVQAFAAEDAAADFNGDGQVDFFDYLDYLEAFAAGC